MVNDDILKRITNLLPDENGDFDESEMYEISEEMLKAYKPVEYIIHLFKVFESFPDANFGSPGPYVHFIEKFYPNYLEILKDSIRRRPTMQTIWMVNRILNSDLSVKTRNELLNILKSVLKNSSANEFEREQAKEFLVFQEMQK